MSKKVYIKDWLNYKPYITYSNVDTQYLEIANRINKILQQIPFLKNELELYEEDIVEMSVFLTCYLEDLVSETNIWNTFASIHKEKYNKELPFYDTKNYNHEEVNKVDIQFLIWYFLNLNNPERFLSPYDGYLDFIAEDVLEILDYEFEYVDENKILKDFFALKPNSDFYETRRLVQAVLFESYLFKIDSAVRLKEEVDEILSNTDDENENMKMRMINSATDHITHSSRTKLLALKGKDWLSEIIGKENKMHEIIKNTSEKISSWFLYKGENNNYIHFQHVASDIIFDLSKESFNANFELSDNNIYYIEMISWNNEWTFSGVTFKTDFDANLILDEKNDMLKINIGTQFDEKIQAETQEALKSQEAIFINIFKSPILFIEAKDLQFTLDKFMNNHNKSLSKNQEDYKQKLEDAKQQQKEKGYLGEDNSFEMNEEGNCVVYYNPTSGIEIFNDICDIFPDKNNPFYEGENVNEIKMFLFSPIYSKELTEYFIEKYAHKFEFFKTGTGKKYLNDFDFLLRFWKNDNYYSKPSITLI